MHIIIVDIPHDPTKEIKMVICLKPRCSTIFDRGICLEEETSPSPCWKRADSCVGNLWRRTKIRFSPTKWLEEFIFSSCPLSPLPESPPAGSESEPVHAVHRCNSIWSSSSKNTQQTITMFEQRRSSKKRHQQDDENLLFVVAGGFRPREDEGRGKQKSGFNPWCQRSLTRLRQVKNSFRTSVNEIRASEIENSDLSSAGEISNPKRKRRSLFGFLCLKKDRDGRHDE